MAKVRRSGNVTVITIDPNSLKISGFDNGENVVVIAERGKITIMKVEDLK